MHLQTVVSGRSPPLVLIAGSRGELASQLRERCGFPASAMHRIATSHWRKSALRQRESCRRLQILEIINPFRQNR